ncbi:hypothetical protein ABIA31_002163 [Catenulispora sp. MAP5-51]|uniref:hypothetical protein n=1 Tax=Catenulispora sp. MAP5-51 TaxID=3156298 RepID=UPI0035119E5D
MRVRLGSTRRAHARPAAALRLPAAYDLLDVPAAAGHRVLLQLERLGTPLGPVLTVPAGHEGREVAGGGSRLRFFVEAGTTASFLADLKELGWDPDGTDIRTVGVVLAAETPLPAAGSARWVRPPETVAEVRVERVERFERAERGERGAMLPPARLLLGALAHGCRRAEARGVLFAGSRVG